MIEGERYSRNIGLFGSDGQDLICDARVGVVGLGGLGSHIVQQLTYLGVERLVLVDPDVITPSSLNRVIGATPPDVDAREPKVEVARRMARHVQPGCEIDTHTSDFREPTAAAALLKCSSIVAGVDDDAARLDLTELCSRGGVPLFDVATDTGETGDEPWYGGRVLFSAEGERCAVCMDLLDQAALTRAGMSADQVDVDERMYGIRRESLAATGPSVVSLNGLLASLAVMEWMVWTTALRQPAPLLEYRGPASAVFVNRDRPRPGCYYCALWPGRRASA